jgi:hypothetical protein
MINSQIFDLNGKNDLMEPILGFGKNFGIKLLYVYDFLCCEVMCQDLLKKLVEQGLDKALCENICEKACIVSFCLYNFENERVFNDGLEVLRGLTSEELVHIYGEYCKLVQKISKLNKISCGILEKVKNIEFKKTLENLNL